MFALLTREFNSNKINDKVYRNVTGRIEKQGKTESSDGNTMVFLEM